MYLIEFYTKFNKSNICFKREIKTRTQLEYFKIRIFDFTSH